MFEQDTITHHIQKYIIGVLIHQKYARFRDLKPPRVDSNLYSYHLKKLLKQKIIQKIDERYTLTLKGLMYIDRVSEKNMSIRSQPKIITMLVIQNSNGDVLLQKRTKQPYIDQWTLPYGKLHIDDATIEQAALREADEKLGLKLAHMTHAGDCYIRVYSGGDIFTSTLVHVFFDETDDITTSDGLQWFRPHKLDQHNLAPAVRQIVARTFFRDPYFFEEYTEELMQ